MFLYMFERDQVVGRPDFTVDREYVLGGFDTLSHAVRVSDEHENKLVEKFHAIGGWSRTVTGPWGTRTEYSERLVDHGRPHEYGDVIRTTWLSIQF
jgi:hypothetical protein